jgi:hypothetical protein
VPIKGASMRRRLVASYRANSYLTPAAARLIEIFERSASSQLPDDPPSEQDAESARRAIKTARTPQRRS